MLDDSGSFAGTAARELKEEAHLDIQASELLDLTELALSEGSRDFVSTAEELHSAMYPSPGKIYTQSCVLFCRWRMLIL